MKAIICLPEQEVVLLVLTFELFQGQIVKELAMGTTIYPMHFRSALIKYICIFYL